MNRKAYIASLSLCLASALPLSGSAAQIDITVTNLTQGIYFTPLLISGHSDSVDLFELGSSASTDLQAMAEGGSIAELDAAGSALGAVNVLDPASGFLAPSAATHVMGMDTGSNSLLSIVAMILPSNDGFVGLDSWPIPDTAGTYTIYLNAYDAGTEANDEIVNGGGAVNTAGIPADPGGNNGSMATGVTAVETNATVHIHRGTIGDTDASGGSSDLDSRIHRWLNPVAKVIVTVN